MVDFDGKHDLEARGHLLIYKVHGVLNADADSGGSGEGSTPAQNARGRTRRRLAGYIENN
jgi:hypothetical protein